MDGKKKKIYPQKNSEYISFKKENSSIKMFFNDKFLEYFEKEFLNEAEKKVKNIEIKQDKEGKIVFNGTAEDGILLNRDKLLRDLNNSLNNNGEDVTAETTVVLAKVSISPDIKVEGVKELIGVGHTAFVGSPKGRMININTGISKYNGLVIKKGEEFSFNENLGPIDAENGYVKELVIKAEGTIPEFGGGICQVSSTAYKAALFSGLPITERSNHSYAVGYYAQIDGHGLDSTIYTGVKDLRFVNDTPGDIIIQAYTDGTDAYFKFYGTSDGRKVKMEGPFISNYRSAGGTELIPTKTLPPGAKKVIESAHGGFDVVWNRIISKPDQEEQKEKILSKYRATSNKILVGSEN